MRQAVFISLGLALGIGLVITVTAAAAGVRNAQGSVLKALYGVGTDVTVTKTPTAGSINPGSFGFGFNAGTSSVDGVGPERGELGPLSSGTLSTGRTFTSADAVFLLASLLTMAAVSRRVREFGTLKALGWKSRRIVGQVMGESVAMGVIGGIIGVGLGFAGARLVFALSPKLTASPGQTTGSATPGGAQQFGFPAAGPPAGQAARPPAAGSPGRPAPVTRWPCTCPPR